MSMNGNDLGTELKDAILNTWNKDTFGDLVVDKLFLVSYPSGVSEEMEELGYTEIVIKDGMRPYHRAITDGFKEYMEGLEGYWQAIGNSIVSHIVNNAEVETEVNTTVASGISVSVSPTTGQGLTNSTGSGSGSGSGTIS